MTFSHKSMLLGAALLGLMLAATELEAKRLGGGRSSGASRPAAKPDDTAKARSKAREKEEESPGSSIKIRVRNSEDAKSPAAASAAPAAARQPERSSMAIPAAAAAAEIDHEEQRGRNEERLRHATEAEDKRAAEKQKHAAALAEWEKHQAEQAKQAEKQRLEKQAKAQLLERGSQCVFKAVMSDEEIARCRQVRR